MNFMLFFTTNLTFIQLNFIIINMIDKYFGFKTLDSEQSVVESLHDHSKIDENELFLLRDMISSLCGNRIPEIEDARKKINQIHKDSSKTFANTESQIIQAHFDLSKQHDLLRIFQRIDVISSNITYCADHIAIFTRLNGILPIECHSSLVDMVDLVNHNHTLFKKALHQFSSNKHSIIAIIHEIIDCEKDLNKLYLTSIEQIYRLANENKIMKGYMRCLENIFESFSNLGKSIETASTSLEWLLIN